MSRIIKKVAVLGSGIMGSRIACHFANCGVPVLLLDITPKELTEEEKAKGLGTDHPTFRNRIVNNALQQAIQSNPAPLYKKSYASRISTGNFTDDLPKIANCDWVIEVVVENLDIKKSLFEQVEKYRKAGTLITSNTSGIPINSMCEGRSEDFRTHFCGTHFFNPPRYLPLLEIIPGPETSSEVTNFLMEFGDLHLGKTVVVCKDTPAFIANRIGVYSIMALFHIVEKMGLTVDEVERLTGPLIGRPKSATFRTCDVVGLDTLAHVAAGVFANCPKDEQRELFNLPSYVAKMVDKKWLGDKTKQGFFKKVKQADGKSEIQALDLNTLEYGSRSKVKFESLEQAKVVADLRQRMKALVNAKDKAGEFYRASLFGLFSYVSFRIPEISDELHRIDDAMRAGFGWELGPFELWDAVGVEDSVNKMDAAGIAVAPWVKTMLQNGCRNFYETKHNARNYYGIGEHHHVTLRGQESFLVLDNFRENVIWKNAGCSLLDIGDGIINLEFHTKMNTIGSEVVEGINKAVEIAEKNHHGLVIGNNGANFSAGANLGLVYMFALEQEFDEIDFAVRAFQAVNMRIKLASVPVVVAPHGLTLGGGCEMCLHAPAVQAAAETYTGLVEFGVGLIPGGGGTKEFALRASDTFASGDIELNVLRERFLTIGTAKVSTSAAEAFDMGILRHGQDRVSVNKSRLINDAKARALNMALSGYTKATERRDIKVLGRSGLGMVYAGANTMLAGKYISTHDQLISQKLGHILCGGDLSGPTLVSEQYLLDLEREAFLSLCGERKTLERIQSILTTGKPLRN